MVIMVVVTMWPVTEQIQTYGEMREREREREIAGEELNERAEQRKLTKLRTQFGCVLESGEKDL